MSEHTLQRKNGKPMNIRLFLSMALGLTACTLQVQPAFAVDRADSEPSWTAPRPALQWRLAPSQALPATSVRYPEVSIRRIFEVSKKNTVLKTVPQQVGIGRVAAREGATGTPTLLRWTPLRTGGSVARMTFTSPVALAMRVAIDTSALNPRVTLRFAGSDRPDQVVAQMTGREMRRLADAKGIFWSPSTDGESQLIEVHRPRGVPAHQAQLTSPMISHLLGNSTNSFTLAKALGDADSCQKDVACKVGELGPGFIDAKASTLLVQYVADDGSTYGCTATLVTDKVTESQVPYILTHNTCAVKPQGTYAATMNTFWDFEATSCGSGVAGPVVQLSGGAVALVGPGLADVGGAGFLLRLNEPAPAGAVFSGWDASPLVAGQTVVGIHHPRADVKKVVLGQFRETFQYVHNIGWTSGGYMEPTSWGSGLFTPDANGYHLRGVARNGSATCANSTGIDLKGNVQEYGRFDLFYPYARKWLAPGEAATNDFDAYHDGLTVRFTARLESNTYDLLWYFGDATYGRDVQITKTYKEAGVYRVVLEYRVGGETKSIIRQTAVGIPVPGHGAHPLVPPPR